jgi:hypothetical protein
MHRSTLKIKEEINFQRELIVKLNSENELIVKLNSEKKSKSINCVV